MSYNALLITSSLTSVAYLGLSYLGTAALSMLPTNTASGVSHIAEATSKTLPIYLAAPTLALLHHLLVLLVPCPSLKRNKPTLQHYRGPQLPAFATTTLNILLLALLSVFCTASGMTTLVVAFVDIMAPEPLLNASVSQRDQEDEMIRNRLHAFQAIMGLCQGMLLALMFAHALLGAKREAREECCMIADVEALLEEQEEEEKEEDEEEQR